MSKNHSFKFVDNDLNRELVGLLKAAGIDHTVDQDGVVHYAADDREVIENDLICSIRAKVFPSWQILTFPPDWTARYRDYISRHDIPLREELSDGELWFLIPRKHRPHSWKLEGSKRTERLAKNEA